MTRHYNRIPDDAGADTALLAAIHEASRLLHQHYQPTANLPPGSGMAAVEAALAQLIIDATGPATGSENGYAILCQVTGSTTAGREIRIIAIDTQLGIQAAPLVAPKPAPATSVVAGAETTE